MPENIISKILSLKVVFRFSKTHTLKFNFLGLYFLGHFILHLDTAFRKGRAGDRPTGFQQEGCGGTLAPALGEGRGARDPPSYIYWRRRRALPHCAPLQLGHRFFC